MRNFNIKSMILGIGIGFIITSVLSMIYLAGINPSTSMTKEEIIRQAKQYGLVEENSEFVKSQPTTKPEVTAKPKVTTKPQVTASNTVEQYIKFTVNPGDTSEVVAEKLFKLNLINNKTAFINELSDMGLEASIGIGEFKIEKGTDLKRIIKIITST